MPCPLLPPCLQLAGLTRLRSLALCNCSVSTEGLACLAALPALQSLRLASNDGLPSTACLAALSGQLTALCIEPAKGSPAAGVGAALEAGLPQLTALRRLVLRVPHGASEYRGIPAALPSLPSLRAFAWLVGGSTNGGGGPPQRQLEGPLPPLPAGAWLRQLTALALPAGTAAASPAALAAAASLQHLMLDHFCSLAAEPQGDLLRFAGRHPALQRIRLTLGTAGSALDTAAFVQAAAAMAANDRLSISAEAGPVLPEEEWEEELSGLEPWPARP